MPSNKGVKISLGDFLGGAPANELDLPTAPKQRGPGDDGAFQRRSRNDDRPEREISRADQDSSWRRSGGGGSGGGFSNDRGGGGGGFGNDRGGYNDQRSGGGGGFDRGGHGSSDRGGYDRGSGYDRGGDRGGYDRRGGSGGYDRDGGSRFGDRGGDRGGYDRDRGGGGFDRAGGRDGGFERGSNAPAPAAGGVRTRLQLKPRTVPLAEDPKVPKMESPPKSDPFGGAAAVNTNKPLSNAGAKTDNSKEALEPALTEEKVVESVRPRLQLKPRTVPIPEDPKTATPQKSDPFGGAAAVDSNKPPINAEVKADNPKESAPALTEEKQVEKEETKKTTAAPEKQRRVPEVVNSRAAMLGDSPDAKRDSNSRRDRDDRGGDRSPPPVVNKRFADLAIEEREKNKEREDRRGPPPVANSRFAAAAENDRSTDRERDDRGPPLVTNSRFAAAAEADRSTYRDRDDRGPPPIANSRFAAAAEADRSTYRDRDDRGPPLAVNSRFAAAAEADRSSNDFHRNDLGPPPVANSRFAAAAALAEEEREREGFGRDQGSFGRNDVQGGPIRQNSRFTDAMAADEDYVEPNQRGYGDDRDRFDDRGRGGDRDRFDDRGRGGDRFDRRDRGGYEEPRRGGYERNNDRGYEDGPAEPEPPKSSVADLLKPKAPPLEENILKVPTKEHADNILKIPAKQKDDDILQPPKKEKVNAAPTKSPAAVETPVPLVDDAALIAEFVSGKRLGDKLKAWLGDQIVPSVENLIYNFLEETQKLNPDITCAWAEPDKYGAALVSLVEDDLLKQVDVLFAVQKYCYKIGMPKLNDEYVIQAMFRSMYKYDLASSEAFEMWKDDESESHEGGKLNAVIQTVDWFNWLEEDAEEDEEEYEEE